jgi:hypothetical protein
MDRSKRLEKKGCRGGGHLQEVEPMVQEDVGSGENGGKKNEITHLLFVLKKYTVILFGAIHVSMK